MSSPPAAPLAPATRLGPYEITAALGAGGMGEVYEARDTRLERRVAVKVLAQELSSDPQLRARLEREAKSISALNHPHICTLHDVGRETVDGREVDFLVLELLEGESLSARLAKGPLPMADVIRHGVEIAEALDAAHRQGIVHRDLKPGNVMLTKSGAKLLDFGLAKSGEEDTRPAELSSLKTLDKPLTQHGTILGTFQYMAPEQLEGQPADARTDIFALGAVFYEMATGRKAFSGNSRTSLIAAIVSSQPEPISSVQAMTPPAFDHVVRKCLEKDPDDRWQSARDVAAELRWIAEGGSRVGLPTVILEKRRNRERLAWTAFALSAVAAAAFGWAWTKRAPMKPYPVRFEIPVPPDVTTMGTPVFSPDGRTIAFEAADPMGRVSLWVRPLNALEARMLPGTEGATRPFWSPDGRFLGFVAGGKVRKMDLLGGPSQVVCDAPTGSDGSWSTSGSILFDGRDNDPILIVPAGGGVARPEVQNPGTAGSYVGWPQFLPDGRHFLYVQGMPGSEPALMLGELGSTARREILKTASRVVYAPPGYLLFVRERTLLAQPFDPVKGELRGEPVALGEGLGVSAVGLASFSVSDDGHLAFRAGATDQRKLLWVDRAGRETPVIEAPAEYRDAQLSPDGRRLAYDLLQNDGPGDIWIRDLERGVSSRFTFDDAAEERNPVWSPDGRRVVYSSARKAMDLLIKDASGVREAELLLESSQSKFATDWSRDGRHILYASTTPDGTFDLWALPTTGDRKPIAIASTPFHETGGSLSPDGRLVAYNSNQSGRHEVYVQDFPEPQERWQISSGGGAEPYWRADGRELYFRSLDGKVQAVPVSTTPRFAAGTPEPLFQGRFPGIATRGRFEPAPDGQRFLVLYSMSRETLTPTTVVLNWTSLLAP
jgi:Tol biopolymer transport system component/tRNA A-37 threonylcarbamoyl transferase component Bud32